MNDIQGGWNREDVAIEHRNLVVSELAHADDIAPFSSFRWAMNHIGLEQGRLLDVGCGCGHYGVLCSRYYPDILYTGTDVSEFMIREARKLVPLGKFDVCNFESNHFEDYAVILASGVIELTPNPFVSLNILLDKMRGHMILNRLRLTGELSHPVEETTYCGQVGNFFEWNALEIIKEIKRYGNLIAWRDWDTQTTLIIRRGINDNSIPVYDGSTRKNVEGYPEYKPYEIAYGSIKEVQC